MEELLKQMEQMQKTLDRQALSVEKQVKELDNEAAKQFLTDSLGRAKAGVLNMDEYLKQLTETQWD